MMNLNNATLTNVEVEIPFVTIAQEMKQKELMLALVEFIMDSYDNQDDVNEVASEVVDILANCFYDDSFIEEVNTIIHTFFANPSFGRMDLFLLPARFAKSSKPVIFAENMAITRYPSLSNKEISLDAFFAITSTGKKFKTFEAPKEDLNEIAFHSNYGRVRILKYLKNEMGDTVVSIEPTTGEFFANNSSMGGYEVSDDQVGEANRTDYRNQLPTTVYPCELIYIDTIRKDIKESITAVLSNPNGYDEYQAFSSQEFTSSAAIRDNEGKIIKGMEKTEQTTPVANCLPENVIVIKDLPRESIRGTVNRMYHLEMVAAKRLGKPVKSVVSKIEVKPITTPVTVDGVTSYRAEITDTFTTLKVKKNGKFVEQKKTPIVLAIGVTTSKLYITPAWWLHKTVADSEVTVVVPKYKQVKAMKSNKDNKYAKHVDIMENMKKSFTLEKEVEVKLDLSTTIDNGKVVFNNPRHKQYFDIANTSKVLRYKFTEPTTGETIETPETFVYDNIKHADSDASEVTAKQFKKATSDNYTEGYTEEDEEETEDEVIVKKESSVIAKTANVNDIIAEIKALGINDVTFQVTTTGGQVFTKVNDKTFGFNVIAQDSNLIVDTKFKISDIAKNLFVKLINVAKV